MKMGDMLDGLRKTLTEKGFIDRDLLVWGRKKEATFLKHEMVLFGVKEGKFMILPFKDFNTVFYDEVRYYTKEEVTLDYSSLTKFITIKLSNGDRARYSTMSGAGNDAKPLVSLFSK